MKRLSPFLVFVVGALLVLVAVTRFVDRGPFERKAVGSEAAYWSAAEQTGAEYDPGAQTVLSPLYPILLSPLASDDPGAVRHARDVLTVVTLVLLAVGVLILTRRLAGMWPAVVSSLAVMVTGPIVLSAGAFTPATVAAVLGLGALVVLDGRRPPMAWVAAGALVGLVVRFHALTGWSLAVLLLLVALIRPTTRRALATACFVGAGCLVLAVSGPLTGNGPLFPRIPGVDIYRGHRVEASGVQPRRGDSDERRWWGYVDFLRDASRDKEQPITIPRASRYWTWHALSEAAKNPDKEVRRGGVKVLATLSGDPLPRDVSVAFIRDRSDHGGLAVVVWAGRILIPLGLAGFFLARRRVGAAVWAGLLSGLLAAAITFADADSRLLTLACSAVGVGLWLQHVFRGNMRARVATLGVTVLAVGIWGLWPALGGVPGLDVQSDDHYFLGTLYDVEKRGSTAIREYERALRINPENPYPHLAIAAMLARDNVNVEAIHELEALREKHPEFVPGLRALANVYQIQEKWPEAAAVYGELIRLEPWNVEHWNNLGVVYVQVGYYLQAATALRRALEIDPDYASARKNLADLEERGLAPNMSAADPLRAKQEEIMAFIRAGAFDSADTALAGAYARFGKDRVEFIQIEGTKCLVQAQMSGDRRVAEKAVALYESIRQSGQTKNNVIYLNNLGASYMATRRFENALAVFEEALRIQPANQRLQMGRQGALDSLGRSEP